MTKKIYHKSDFYYELPEALIARYPLAERSSARMLVATVKSANHIEICDRNVRDLVDYLEPNDLLVFNNTRVLPARLFGKKESGGKVEILVERLKNPHEVSAYIRASKAPKIDNTIYVNDDVAIHVTGRKEALFVLYSEIPWSQLLVSYGEMPIPPYLARSAQESDKQRYQTIYAKHNGAVAAPTAGLHFDTALMTAIAARGVNMAEVTLHVGVGTFQPVRHEDLTAHVMHEEWCTISDDVVSAITACKSRGGRVIAIGTTSLRTLESAVINGELCAGERDTNLFITPGYRFHIVDALFTNFHLPESTLLMLVSAFAGYDNIQTIYRHAISEQYRFYSYGDAMFLPKRLDE
ncbi:MAG: tRNA preQ1(34) S-adenosylmethionine ribosyltransferase-isomerase QueA [Cardiobacteriaceae bacterium]|nr:tRNA preQ1(34) S-adenosylmethionine ribosyltransferase-isomerase QueA [Cardiobacteriaceae bacterium]